MVFEEMSKKVLEKAEGEVAIMERECQDFCNDLEEEFNKSIGEFKSIEFEKFNSESNNLKRTILGKARKEAKEKILNAKSELIDNVYNEAFDKLLNLKSSQREILYRNLLDNFKSSNPSEEIVRVVCQRKDSDFFRNYFSSKVKVSLDNEILGFKLCTSRDEIFDYSFKNLLSLVFDEFEEEIQEILFR